MVVLEDPVRKCDGIYLLKCICTFGRTPYACSCQLSSESLICIHRYVIAFHMSGRCIVQAATALWHMEK